MHIKNTILLIILSITLSSCAVLDVMYYTVAIIDKQIEDWVTNDPIQYADLEANPYKCCSQDYLDHLPEPPIIGMPLSAHKAGEEISIDFQVSRKSMYKYVMDFHPTDQKEKEYLDTLVVNSSSKIIPLHKEFILSKLKIDGTQEHIVHFKSKMQGKSGTLWGQEIYPISGDGNVSKYIEALKIATLEQGYYRVTLKILTAHPMLENIKTTFLIDYINTIVLN